MQGGVTVVPGASFGLCVSSADLIDEGNATEVYMEIVATGSSKLRSLFFLSAAKYKFEKKYKVC